MSILYQIVCVLWERLCLHSIQFGVFVFYTILVSHLFNTILCAMQILSYPAITYCGLCFVHPYYSDYHRLFCNPRHRLCIEIKPNLSFFKFNCQESTSIDEHPDFLTSLGRLIQSASIFNQ